MIISTLNKVPGKFKSLGLISANVVRTRNFPVMMFNGLKEILGLEMTGITQLNNDNRKLAVERLQEETEKLGGNCILNLRFQVTNLGADVFVYGDAVKIDL